MKTNGKSVYNNALGLNQCYLEIYFDQYIALLDGQKNKVG